MKKIAPLIPYAAIVAFCVILFFPLFSTGNWYENHDGVRYSLLSFEFTEAFRHGQIYPHWMPNMYGGFGYPTFAFYQPAYFYLTLLMSFIIKDPLWVMYASLFVMFLIGGTGAYHLSRKICETPFAVFAAFMFLISPYLYVNLYVRGDLSELWAMLVLPWAFWFLLHIRGLAGTSAPQKAALWSLALALVLTVIIMSHPATALFFIPVFSFISLLLCYQDRRFDTRLFKYLSISIIMGVFLSSPYWFTMFQLKQYVLWDVLTEGHYSAQNHVVAFKQLFSTYWGYGHTFTDDKDTLSFQLGAIHFVLASAGFWLGRHIRLIRLSYIFYILLIILMTPLSVGVWEHLRLLRMVQFPWRILSVTAVLQLVCLCGLSGTLKDKNGYLQAGIYGLIFLLSVCVHHKQFVFKRFAGDHNQAVQSYKKFRKYRFAYLNATNEFLPKTVNRKALRSYRGDYPMIQVHFHKGELKEAENSTPFHFVYAFSNPVPTYVAVHQFYFPGYKIIVNGKQVAERVLRDSLLPDGRMLLTVPAGNPNIVEGFYDGPPYRRLRTAVVLLICAALSLFLFQSPRKIKP